MIEQQQTLKRWQGTVQDGNWQKHFELLAVDRAAALRALVSVAECEESEITYLEPVNNTNGGEL